MIKIVIFDLDDTLISEKEYIKSGYRHIANIISKRHRLDFERIFDELLILMNKSTKNVFNRLLDYYQISYSMEDVLFLVDEYRNHIPEISFYKDVIPVIETLKKSGVKTAIITDGYAIAQRNKLSVLNAHSLIDKIVITDELGREYWKPHPKSFEIVKEHFNINFDEVMYVADNPENDFYISKTYPIKTARIIRDDCIYKNRTYLGGIQENFSIKTLEEIDWLLR